MKKSEHIHSIVKIIQSMSTHGAETAYRDWCECFALSIQNGCDLIHTGVWQEREDRYLEIIKRYNKEEAAQFAEMCAHLTLAFEIDPFQDWLGCIYMELFGGQKKLGQCFTPIDLCKACAATTIGDDIPHEVRTLSDECSGGGAMLIAACEHYHTHGVDYQKYLKIYAGDVDSLCVHMTYIQLSLLGARAEVWHRNAITRQVFGFGRFITPMEMLLWPMKYVGGLPDKQNPDPEPTKDEQNAIKLEMPQDTRQVVSIDSLIEANP